MAPFSTLRARGGIPWVSRLPLRVEAQVRQTPITVQRVRFQKPPLRPRRVIAGAVLFFISFQVLGVILEPRLKEMSKQAEEIEKSLPAEERKKMREADLKPWFLPFPGTTEQFQPLPYRGSDPEWQTFVKISKDKRLIEKIKADLANTVKLSCEKASVIKAGGGKNLRVVKHWLDMDFPHSPPPEFQRSGLEWGPGYLAWSTMPIDSLTVFRIRQALWPNALAQSSWSWLKCLVTGQNTVLKPQAKPETPLPNIPGMPAKTSSPSMEAFLARNRRPAGAESQAGDPKDVSGPDDSSGEPKSETSRLRAKLVMLQRKMQEGKDALSLGKGVGNSPDDKTKEKATVASILGESPTAAFKQKFLQTWRPAPCYPPRGCVLVSGLVELDGGPFILVCAVKGAWDPNNGSFDMRTTQIQMKRLAPKKQGPMRA